MLWVSLTSDLWGESQVGSVSTARQYNLLSGLCGWIYQTGSKCCHHILIQIFLNPDWCTELFDPAHFKSVRRAQRKEKLKMTKLFKVCSWRIPSLTVRGRTLGLIVLWYVCSVLSADQLCYHTISVSCHQCVWPACLCSYDPENVGRSHVNVGLKRPSVCVCSAGETGSLA